jgi:hypothetical protein
MAFLTTSTRRPLTVIVWTLVFMLRLHDIEDEIDEIERGLVR